MKIEMKGSLWLAEITSGCDIDWDMNVIVVSANTYEEAKNAVKIYYQNKDNSYRTGLVFDDGEKWQYSGEPYKEGYSKYSYPFETDYGDGEVVKLTRLEVVYDGGELAKPSLHLLPKE